MSKPQIRFKGFEDEWQRLPLYSCGTFNPKTDLPSTFEYVDLESVVGTVMTRHRTEDKSSAPSRAQRLARKGDIFYQTVRPYQKNNLLFELEENNYVFSTGYAQIRPIINGRFLFSILQKDSFVNEVLLNCTGTSYPAINSTVLSELLITKPDSEEEQANIGDYFKQIDEMISEVEREVDRLEKMKQASLQKMFPRPGATAPEIRFKGFTGDWICGKLSELLEIDDNRNSQNELGREDVLSVSGEFGLVNQIKFQGRSFAGASLHNYKITHSGQVVYTKSPLKAQPFGIVKSNQYGDGLLSPLYAVYNTINNACADFIHYYFEPVARLNNYLRPLINKGAKNTILISDETALQGVIHYPRDAKEQFLIADYFLKLDSLLFTKRQKLVKLRNIKQACLDKMFVNTSDL